MGENSVNNRISSLQSLRAIAFLGIFISHCGIGQFGSAGVSIFFTLSGFVTLFSYYSKDIENTIIDSTRITFNKIKRMYPLHITTMVMFIVLLCIPTIKGYNFSQNLIFIGKCLLNAFLLQCWGPNEDYWYSLNGVSWFLSTSLFIYLFIPPLINHIKKYKTKNSCFLNMLITFLAMLVVSMLSKIIENILNIEGINLWIVKVCPFYRLGDFFIGCNVGYLFINKKDEGDKNKLLTSFMEVIVLLYWFYTGIFVDYSQNAWLTCTLIFIPFSAMIIYLFAIRKGFVTKIMDNKMLVWLGNISPYLYMLHYIIIRYVRLLLAHYVFVDIGNVEVCVIAFIITLLLSNIYIVAERSMKLISKRKYIR